MNQFEKYYNELQDLEDTLSKQDLDDYTKQNAENQKDAILNKITSDDSFYFIFNQYIKSEELGNDFIDFDDIWAKKVNDYYDILVANDIKNFTVSETSSELMDIINNFVNCGCKILGVLQVKRSNKKTVPALKFSI